MSCSFIGIDVSKGKLSCWSESGYAEIENSSRSVAKYLKSLPAGSRLAVENTGSFHVLLAEKAYSLGFSVYIVNPRDSSRFRKAVSPRAKTDKIDARAIALCAAQIEGRLRPFAPLPDEAKRLRNLLRRRGKLLKAENLLRQSFAGSSDLKKKVEPILKQIKALSDEMAGEMERLSSSLEGSEYLREIPSVGPIVAATLMSVFHGAEFASSDAAVAFAGLDCRVHQSGKFIGQSKISRQGDRLLRKHLYLAALTGKRLPCWRPYYERMLAKGLKKIQAIVALSRKILRAAWSVYHERKHFDVSRIYRQPIDLRT